MLFFSSFLLLLQMFLCSFFARSKPVTFFVLKFLLFISFGGAKTRKKVEFFPPLGELKGGILKSRIVLKWFCFGSRTPLPLRGISPKRGEKAACCNWLHFGPPFLWFISFGGAKEMNKYFDGAKEPTEGK